MALIECIIKRVGGSRVEIGDTQYHFAPASDGSHVAQVADPEHIARFLSIPEGYRLIDTSPETLVSSATQKAPDATLESLRAEYEAITGKAADKRWNLKKLAVEVASARQTNQEWGDQ